MENIDSKTRRMKRKYLFFAAGFAVLHIVMYVSVHRFWIGGSSFLPMIGQFGAGKMLLIALVVNLGVIVGAFISAKTGNEFQLRLPKKENVPRLILGGILIGIGITLNPGTCTTVFITGLPMFSVASVLSGVGIFLGAYFMFKILWKKI